ncbi:MAG: cytochrome c maturation protein CcmE [Cypionkella sp.]|nr:cytochrome c maturation protein CcmE [Cypionkella sp.]
MKSLKKQRRIQLILAAFALISVTTALVGYAMKDGINFYRSPAEVAAKAPPPGEVFRIGGLVEVGSLKVGQGEVVTFNVTDTVVSIPATFEGILPDLFAEGAGMVGTGVMQDGTFVASEILAKHDESYMPKEVVDALKEQGVYVEPAKD